MAFPTVTRSCAVALIMVLAVVPHTYAQVTCPDSLINATNGEQSLSTLTQFNYQAGLTDRINKTDNVTFLAPNNDAFNAFNITLQQNNFTFANISDKDNDRAASILLYHIIPGILDIDGFSLQTMPTMLEGHNLTVIDNGTLNPVTFIGAASNATFTPPLTTSSPGHLISVCSSHISEIFVVDRVLLPNATLASIPIYASGASTLAFPGRWAFALSTALTAALMM